MKLLIKQSIKTETNQIWSHCLTGTHVTKATDQIWRSTANFRLRKTRLRNKIAASLGPFGLRRRQIVSCSYLAWTLPWVCTNWGFRTRSNSRMSESNQQQSEDAVKSRAPTPPTNEVAPPLISVSKGLWPHWFLSFVTQLSGHCLCCGTQWF